MARFDRYMLSQLVVIFGFFSLILVLVYWINRAVVLFDRLIADGQSAAVFFEFTALTLPTVIRLALPLSAFASAVYVTNRMTTQDELVVIRATGFSPYRIARPVLYFGLIVFVLMSVLMHLLVPMASARLDVRQNEIAQNVTARLLSPGQFLEPTDGFTFYVGNVTPEGELQNVFLSDLRNPDRDVAYTAAKAYLVSNDAGTQLVMTDGVAQILHTDNQRLATTTFTDFVYDIGNFLTPSERKGRRDSQIPTLEILQANDALLAETRRTKPQLLTRVHDRISQSILGVIAPLVGFAALLTGGFSRFGVWRQIVVAVFLIIAIKSVETAGLDIAERNPDLWMTAYIGVTFGGAVVIGLLYLAAHPAVFRRGIST